MKAQRGCRRIGVLCPNLGPRRGWAVSTTTAGGQVGLDAFWRRENLFLLPRIEPQTVQHVASCTDCAVLVTRCGHKLRGLSPRANYTDRAAAAGRRS